MTSSYAEVAIGELFSLVNGRPKFIRDYIDGHGGPYPVYSASLRKPFGFVDEFEYDGRFLTWVMNGYGGRVQEIAGRFSANRDRGVMVPRDGVTIPDLTYLRFAMEPQLVAAAVGRRVDGRLNEYTKIYPESAAEVVVPLLVDASGTWDLERMATLGARLLRIEAAQCEVQLAHDALARAVFPMDVGEETAVVGLGNADHFELSIGERVLRAEHAEHGVPVYSANARVPFGTVAKSNLKNFQRPSLLWGIDGIFDWNIIPAEAPFATTDHCGRLQIVHDEIDPEYAYYYLRATRERYGFDRVFRASLSNMRAEVTVSVPVNSTGAFCLETQRVLARTLRDREQARATALDAISEVLKARTSIEQLAAP